MERVRGMDEIRAAERHLIDIQTAGCSEEELKEGQRILNEKYDKFVKNTVLSIPEQMQRRSGMMQIIPFVFPRGDRRGWKRKESKYVYETDH